MKILIVVANFVPEIGSAAHIYFDLAKAFVKRGHQVDVITSYPRDFYLNEKDRGIEHPLNETIEGIEVHRCKYLAIRDNIIVRGLEHFVLPKLYFKTYKELNKKFDVCLMYIPPLPLYYLARKIKKYDGTPSVLNYQDFHPKELVDVGILKNPVMIKIMEHIERASYKNADFITVLSPGGINYVVERGGDMNKIRHIFNGVLLSELDKCLIRKDFKEQEKIQNKFLISYAGILSLFQNIDTILDVAKELSNQTDIVFYIIGDGIFKNDLEKRIKDEVISNVRLLPLQPREEYFNIVNSSDISLILLDERMETPCLPGKTANLIASKQPIIAIAPEESETTRFVKTIHCGFSVEPGNTKQLVDVILKLKNDEKQRKKCGENGRTFLESNMNFEKSSMEYETIFNILNFRSTKKT